MEKRYWKGGHPGADKHAQSFRRGAGHASGRSFRETPGP